jgi:ABC-2 type transport system permease protein
MTRFLKQALVIARRDFTAVVLTPTFLIFLLAPLFMLGVATIGGLGAANVIEGGRERAVILVAPSKAQVLRAAERRLRGVVGAEPGPPPVTFETGRDPQTALRREGVSAVLDPASGQVLHKPGSARDADYLALVASAASGESPAVRQVTVAGAGSASKQQRSATAFATVFAMFFLSLVLASQAVSTLAEERNNKVIEILAAAAPLEAVFLGKLIGLLGVALLFTAFWGGIAAAAAAWTAGAGALAAVAPVGGLLPFALLFLGYFVLAFLLLGAVFLGVGAQAATMREIQMLSLPVTIFQVGMFAWASAGAGEPNSAVAIGAAIFPYSSPFAMAARGAMGVPAWQHLAAFAWQLLWLAVTVTVAARLFRRGVLKSGGGRG